MTREQSFREKIFECLETVYSHNPIVFSCEEAADAILALHEQERKRDRELIGKQIQMIARLTSYVRCGDSFTVTDESDLNALRKEQTEALRD